MIEPEHPSPQLLTVQAAAQRLGISKSALRARIRRDDIPATKIRGRVYVILEPNASSPASRPSDVDPASLSNAGLEHEHAAVDGSTREVDTSGIVPLPLSQRPERFPDDRHPAGNESVSTAGIGDSSPRLAAVIQPIHLRPGRVSREEGHQNHSNDEDMRDEILLSGHEHTPGSGTHGEPSDTDKDEKWWTALIATVAIATLLTGISIYLYARYQGPATSPDIPRGGEVAGVLAEPSPESRSTATAAVVRAPDVTTSASVAPASAGGTAAVTSAVASPSPSPSPTGVDPTMTADPAWDLVARATAADETVTSGTLEAIIDYGNGTRATAYVDFDLDRDGGVPRLHLTTSYVGPASSQQTELIMIGDDFWQRTGTGEWMTPTHQESAWGTVRSYLPQLGAAIDPHVYVTTELAILTWHDAGRNADATLELDPATSIPLRLIRAGRSSNATLTVIYHAWNTPVEIARPG